MKPRVFIGSSVEGLNVAYAIQQNLTHDVEPTVWDQGIFDLSKTTIESLMKAVDDSDFGIFVFSPDDIIKMRGGELNSIRDNVIFEFGLFTGRLGRERVFFVKPDGLDMHLPTDFLGITPGSYNPNREDGRLEAATGPACNQIRQAIKKIPITSSDNTNDGTETTNFINHSNTSDDWMLDLFNDNFDEARNKLNLIMSSNGDEKELEHKAWMAYIDFRENNVVGLDILLRLTDEHRESKLVFSHVSQMLSWEEYYDQALDVINRALELFGDDLELLLLKSTLLSNTGEKNKAIDILKNKYSTYPNVAIALTELYEEDDLDTALKTIHAAYCKYPNSKEVLYKYARILQDKDLHKEALYLLNYLCINSPKEPLYLGYLSNTCLNLNLYDKAMSSLKKAIEFSNENDAWLLHNVGNLLKNKGFYSEAEVWLRKGLEIEPSSEYALDRLASVIKSKGEESKKLSVLCNEGKQLIRERSKANPEPDNQSQVYP